MKNIAAMFVFFLASAQLFSQTLFTYGPYSVSTAEFLRAYNKNKTPVTDKARSFGEYLDLYSKFKLKVRSAKDQHLDTLQQLRFDLQNFRGQVAESYMNDEKEVNGLVEEALQRSKKDIHLIHFYASLHPNISPADTLKAYQAMKELSGLIKEGKTGYKAIAAEISTKYTDFKETDLGYITVFSVPYDIENLVYGLKPNEISGLYRTRSALHMFINLDERKSAGKWKVAQILLSLPPDASDAEIKIVKDRADSVYRLLTGGADFARLVNQFSEDKLTYMNGGELPEFGTGKFEPSFENNVFALKKDGEISKPFFTGDGYHIVKRLQQRDIIADYSDEAFIANLKQQILQDSRINTAKAAFLKTIKLKTGYKKNETIKDADLFRFADSINFNSQSGNYPISRKTIFSFNTQHVRGADWLDFIKNYKLNADVYKGENDTALLDKFISVTTFDYYRKHLEEYNIDFKYQMEEFKEGNMLFEVMERNVWNKASNDSIGLKKYYDIHKTGYKWGASADILLFNTSDSKVATSASTALRNGGDWKKLVEESDGKLQADSGRYELSQMQLPAGTVIREGLISPSLNNSGDNNMGFIKVLKMFPANEQRSYNDAKGLVINDYQNYLEEKWIAALKGKYPVRVNKTVFASLLK